LGKEGGGGRRTLPKQFKEKQIQIVFVNQSTKSQQEISPTELQKHLRDVVLHAAETQVFNESSDLLCLCLTSTVSRYCGIWTQVESVIADFGVTSLLSWEHKSEP
jgi:hypothetical protein